MVSLSLLALIPISEASDSLPSIRRIRIEDARVEGTLRTVVQTDSSRGYS